VVFKDQYEYQKVGVFLTGLVPADHHQIGLFTELPDVQLAKLSQAVDGTVSTEDMAGTKSGWPFRDSIRAGR
jgi:hypothetical protein